MRIYFRIYELNIYCSRSTYESEQIIRLEILVYTKDLSLALIKLSLMYWKVCLSLGIWNRYRLRLHLLMIHREIPLCSSFNQFWPVSSGHYIYLEIRILGNYYLCSCWVNLLLVILFCEIVCWTILVNYFKQLLDYLDWH